LPLAPFQTLVSRGFSISLDFRSTPCYSQSVGTVTRTDSWFVVSMRSLRKLLILLAAVAIGLPPARAECSCQSKRQEQQRPACCQAKADASHHDCCGGEKSAPCNCPGCECDVKSASAASAASAPQLIPVTEFPAQLLAIALPSQVQVDLNQTIRIWRLARGPTLAASPQQLFCVLVI
jgi:hypothetical protein